MIDPDLENTHLCIKCTSTIVGLDLYIDHRKNNCRGAGSPNVDQKIESRTNSVSTGGTAHENKSLLNTNLNHPYGSFADELEPPSSYVVKSEHGGKSSKSLSDAYDLNYELGADVFFQSLQLQSVQSAGPSTSGKTGSTPQTQIHRQKLLPMQQEHAQHIWMDTQASTSGQNNSETLMKAVHDMIDTKKHYDGIFKPISFEQESPEASEDDEMDVDEDDEDPEYDSITEPHASGGKWKLPLLSHSPPVVPVTHTGGKWKPENRPNLQVTHTQLARLSPNWDETPEDMETLETSEEQHPPEDHTRGKWVPGTKVQRLDYKEQVVLARTIKKHYWCNICGRKLQNKLNYERHLKTKYHKKRAEPELQLEKASIRELRRKDICKSLKLEAANLKTTDKIISKKRKRRATFIKCELCKHVMPRHLIGKHLISHYHYRRMQMAPQKSLGMILEHIHSIVLQSPFQCRPCRFYANTEEEFLVHWNSPEHLDGSEGPGKFWCSYCHFECEDNNQMRRHLMSVEHKEVILVINRSVPICICKKLSINCRICGQSFPYNVELRRHLQLYHPGIETSCTASDTYQSRFKCTICDEIFSSIIALQRHGKNKHSISKYYCTICQLEFNSPCKARRHRKTADHKLQAASSEGRNLFKKLKKTKNTKSSLECNKCNFVASSEVEAMLHELSHPKREAKKISTTKKTARRKISQKAVVKPLHIKLPSKTNSEQVNCATCDKDFATKEELKAHRNSKHPEHMCSSCGKSFNTPQALGRHTRICEPTLSNTAAANADEVADKPWSCEECNFRTGYESELLYHRLYHVNGLIKHTQLLQCPLCSKAFRRHSLRFHLRQHTGDKIFQCDHCSATFSRAHNLKDHIRNVHSVQKKQPKFQCDVCGKVFMKKHNLATHNKRHGSVQSDYECSHKGCKYSARSQTLLRVHMASHAQDNLKCEHGECDYVGKSLLHLQRHQRFHSEPSKVFSCDRCDFKSRIKGHLRRHMLLHTGERPHKCPHCNYRCGYLDNLRKHVLKTGKHPGKFVYECELCRQVYGDVESQAVFKTNIYQEYKVHMSNVHPLVKMTNAGTTLVECKVPKPLSVRRITAT